MKAALQEEDEDGEGDKPVQRDAKGREILSPEEKAKREEKSRKAAAEVSFQRYLLQVKNTDGQLESCGTCGEGRETCGEPGAKA